MTLVLDYASHALDAPSFVSAFSSTYKEANRFTTNMFSHLCFKVVAKSIQIRGNLAMMPLPQMQQERYILVARAHQHLVVSYEITQSKSDYQPSYSYDSAQ